MNNVRLYLKDYATITVDADPGIRMEISDRFTFMAPNYKFHPLYKKRVWDGKIRLFNQNNGEINAGLYDKLRHFCAQRGYMIELDESRFGYPGQKNELDLDLFNEFLQTVNLPFMPRDYQYKAVIDAIKNTRNVLLSPTGSGKSFIIYLLARWYLWSNFERFNTELPSATEKILLIVPTTSLVEQMYSDFESYGFDAETYCHKIYSGQDKTSDKPIIISTWQSIYKFPGKWFEQYHMIFGDECHGFKAKSMSAIMNKSRFARFRYGLTGTLDGMETNELTLEGLFGPITKVTTTKKLQDNKTLAPLDISIIKFNYPEKDREYVMRKRPPEEKRQAYHEEIDFLTQHEGRNRFICNLACDQKGNSLVMFQFVEKHGKILYELIKDKVDEGRKVFFIHGSTDTEDREAQV
jgi:superfamily II DNA or RNA helicase